MHYPAFGGVTDEKYEVTIASDKWTIDHQLKSIPAVEAYTYIDGALRKVNPSSITYPTTDIVEITWSTPRTGFVRLITTSS